MFVYRFHFFKHLVYVIWVKETHNANQGIPHTTPTKRGRVQNCSALYDSCKYKCIILYMFVLYFIFDY